MTWRMAVDQCFENNSHLAYIKSPEVTNFIHTLVLQMQTVAGRPVYIGKSLLPIYDSLDIANSRSHFVCLFLVLRVVYLIRFCCCRLEWYQRRKCVEMGWWYSCYIFQLVCRNSNCAQICGRTCSLLFEHYYLFGVIVTIKTFYFCGWEGSLIYGIMHNEYFELTLHVKAWSCKYDPNPRTTFPVKLNATNT